MAGTRSIVLKLWSIWESAEELGDPREGLCHIQGAWASLCFLVPLDDSDVQQSLRTPAREVVYPVSEGNSETLVPR